MRKGDVVLVNFGEKTSDEHTQKGWRPAVIIDVVNSLQACTVIPCTTRLKKPLPTHIPINKTEISAIKEESIFLCENCTLIQMDNIIADNEPYNICIHNTELWGRIVAGLSIQLSNKYDYCAQYVGEQYRRGSIICVDGVSVPAIILSNEKNNEYSNNISVALLVNGTPNPEKFYDMKDECFRIDTVAILNVSQHDVVEYIGYAGKKIANYVTRQCITLLTI